MRKLLILLLVPLGLLILGLKPPPPASFPQPATPDYTTPVVPTPTTAPADTKPQQEEVTRWHGQYFNNESLAGAPAGEREDECIDFDWEGSSPWSGVVGVDHFSVRWTRRQFFQGGSYRFFFVTDDGARLWIDPEVNDFTIINAWTDQPPTFYQSDLVPLQTGHNTLRVDYYDDTANAEIRLWWERLGDYPDWKAEYYKYFNQPRFCDGPIITKNEVAINHGEDDADWAGGSPSSALGTDFWAARWTGSPQFVGGLTRFFTRSDDGVRLWVDANDNGSFDDPGEFLVDKWIDQSVTIWTGDVYLSPGRHQVKVEYYERTGDAVMQLWWRTW